MSNGVTIEVFTNTGNNYPPVEVVQVEENEQPIIVETPQYFAPVQSVNGKIGFVTLNKSDVGLQNVENISITGVSGVLNQKINNLSGDADNKFYLKSNPSGYITGVDTSNLYPRSNPSGFITGVDLSALYPRSNPSGFVTGVDLSLYATISNLATTGSTLSTNISITGSTLTNQINNLSGVSVFTFGDQIINGTKYFNNSVYIHDLYVTGTEFIATVQNNFIESPYILLNLTGGAIDGGIFFVTGTGLTGVNDYGPIIGFDHSNKFKFGVARRSDDLSVLNDIAAVQDITNYSGFVNSNFYPRNNPSGFVTGSVVRPSETGTLYPLSNPSGFITRQKVVYTTGNQTISGAKTFYKTQLNLSGSSLNFYPVIETGATVTVTQANNAVTQTIDTVSAGVQLTRGDCCVLYNPLYDSQGVGNPTNTAWNTGGWADLSNLSSRSYIDLNQVGGGGNFGNAIIGTELIMRDTSTSKYYKFLFSAWQQGAGNNEGYRGFSYERTEVVSVSNAEINGSGVRGNLDFYNRPSVNGTGVLIIGEAGQVPDTVVQTSGAQTISGSKTFTASTLFTSNIQASNIQANSTGIFSDMQISANEMNISGLDLTISSGNLVLSSPTGIPATTGASGIKGSFVWDSGFLYVCTNTNSWKRAALTTW